MIKTHVECPTEYTASLLGNRWKPLILRELLTERSGIMNFVVL